MTDPRDAETIRDSLLLTIRGEHEAIGERVVTAPGTPYYVLATGLALELEGAEFEADAARKEAFPDTASEAGVLKHADFLGIVRTPASHAVIRASIVGTPSSTLTVPADKTLTDDQGLVYLAAVGSVATDGAGLGYITVTARDAGADQNLLAGEVLTWQNGAPTGMASTASTAPAPGDASHVLIVGAAQESIEDLRGRIRVAFKEPPRAQGTRADWVVNLERVEGVASAFVWPRAWQAVGYWQVNTPGTLVAQVFGPAPAASSYVQNGDGSFGLGLRPDFTRIPTPALLARCRGFIEGSTDESGRAVPTSEQVQLRPAGMAPGNYTIQAPALATAVNVTVALVVDPAIAPWPWGVTAGPPAYRTISAATSTTLTLSNVFEITAGSRLAVFVGTSVIAGGWWLTTVVGNPVGLVVTISAPLPVTPASVVGNDVRPDPGLWSTIRALVLAYLHSLGPGDETTEIASQRYPRPADRAQDRFFSSRITDAVQDIAGVAGVSVTLPVASSVTPTVGELFVPGEIRVVIQP